MKFVIVLEDQNEETESPSVSLKGSIEGADSIDVPATYAAVMGAAVIEMFHSGELKKRAIAIITAMQERKAKEEPKSEDVQG
ncbi:hypothetical protein [Microcystis phage Mwe-JY26]